MVNGMTLRCHGALNEATERKKTKSQYPAKPVLRLSNGKAQTFISRSSNPGLCPRSSTPMIKLKFVCTQPRVVCTPYRHIEHKFGGSVCDIYYCFRCCCSACPGPRHRITQAKKRQLVQVAKRPFKAVWVAPMGITP